MTDAAGLRGAEWLGVEAHPSAHTVVSGVKWILDGTPLDRNGLMRAPYADRPGWYGRLQFPLDTIRGILATALTTHTPLHLHITGDSSARLILHLMQSLAPDSVWRPLRVRIEHGDGVSGDLLPLARRLGVVIVQNPTHFAFEPGMLQRRFGGMPPGFQDIRSILAAGIPLAFGSDGPSNPFLNIMFAITHPNNPSEAITREQAVVAYTRGSAYAEFAEREKGTLAPGMLADLAVLSQDIFTVPPQALPATTSVLTMIGGKIVRDNVSRPTLSRSCPPTAP
jgi:predicted amidohydrolase YtcJ